MLEGPRREVTGKADLSSSEQNSESQGQGTVLIPSRNPAALWGYYLGFLSLVPMLGVAAVPFGLWKSLEGLRVHQRDPALHGKIHSIIGLVLGIGGLIVQLLVVGAIVNMIIAGAGNN